MVPSVYADDTPSSAMDLLARGMWAEGRKAELQQEYGLAAMHYFKAYHLFDVIWQECTDDTAKTEPGRKKILAYTDGLAAVHQYEQLRRVRVDLRQLMEKTKPKLISGVKPRIRDRFQSVTLMGRTIPGEVSPPPDVEERPGGLFDRGWERALPFGGKSKSELIVRGRKYIGWTATNTKYKKPSEVRKNTKDIKVDQQLQIQIGGNVAFQFQEALTVNVRFDDAEDDQNQKQSISIKFDPKKETQTPLGRMHPIAEFGDVALVLEGTSYAVYNKSLFGLTGEVTFDDFHFFDLFRAKRFGAKFIATQTKGISAHKEFTGQNTLTVNDIQDISYISKTYYDVLADKTDADKASLLPLKVGSEKVYKDDKNSQNNTANTIEMDVTYNGTTNHGFFDPLVSGQDYFIDYQLGIIQFKSGVGSGAVLGVTYTTSNGTVVEKKLVKDENTSDTFRIFEMKNRYSLGSTNIMRNDPDFIVQIRDLANKSWYDVDSNAVVNGNEKPYNEIFGLDAIPLDGRTDEKNIDFDFGLLKFPDTTPFITELPGYSALSDSEIYYSNIPKTMYKIHVEYVQKTNVYLLNPSVVKNSEIITVDGTRMIRDQDYFIDYSSGFLQFLRPEVITSKSIIVVDYEYYPFTSKSNQTLIGTGLKMDISPNVSWAATFLSNFDDKPSEKPRVNEEPKKVDISDFMVNVNPMGMLKDGLRNFGEPPKLLDQFNFSFTFENASSRFNYNTNGEAILSDFEDAGLITQMGSGQYQWRPEAMDWAGADTMNTRGAFTIGQVSEVGHLDGLNEVQSENLRNQTSLQINYTMSATDTSYVSVSFHLSDIAQDLSKKTFMEFWVKDSNNPDVILDIGILNEDADNDGILDSEDKNLDNLLNSGEDGGIDLGGLIIGGSNGILDSEDRDRDGTLDVDQAFFRADLNNASIVDTADISNGWRRYRVYLSTLIADTIFSNQSVSLKTVKDLRLTFRTPPGKSGSVLVNDISIQGVSWEDDNFADTKTFTVGIVSNRTDPSFTPPASVSSDMSTLDAKALSLSYTLFSGRHITKFLPANDIRLSLYKKMTYWVKSPTATTTGNLGDTVLFRFGPDQNNYFEVIHVLTGVDWAQNTIDLEKIEEDLIRLTIDTSPPYDTTRNDVRFYGSPTLDRIHYLGAGVSSDTKTGTVFLDEIMVKEVEEEKGTANKSSFSSSIFGNLITLSGNQETIDNTFRPIGRINYTGVSDYIPQDQKTQGYSGTLNFSRLTFLDRLLKLSIPVTFSKNKSTTYVNPDIVENVKRADLGSKISLSRAMGFSISRNSNWPSFTANWTDQDEDLSQKTFITRQENTTKNYSISYGQTFERRIFWFIPIGRMFNYSTSFSRGINIRDRDILMGSEKNSYQKSQGDAVGISVHYVPTRWFDWSFNLNHSLSRQAMSETEPLRASSRSRGYSWNWPFPSFIGFTPSFNWTFNFGENFNNETEFKSISSTGGFGASIGLQPERWWRKLKFLTISYSYTISGSAAYQNLPERFGLSAVFDDFYKNIFFFWKGGHLEVTSDTLALLRNSANTSQGHSFGGSIKIWSSLSTTYSTAFNRTQVQSLNSIDLSDAFSFNLNNTLDLKTSARWFRKRNSAALTYSYGFNSSAGKTTKAKNISNSLAWPVSWTDRLRTDWSYTFTFGSTLDRLSVTKNQNSGSAFNLSYLLNNPFKVTTFTGNFMRFENRMELKSGLTWSNGKNSLDGVKKNDSTAYGGNIGLVYDLRDNFRIDGTGSYTVNTNQVTPDDDRSVTSFTATAELRF